MASKFYFGVVISFCFLTLAETEVGAQTLVSRYSNVRYNYVYGAGGDSNTGSDMVEDVGLNTTDTEHTEFANSTAGVLPNGNPYTAGVATAITHAYSVAGDLSSFQSISAEGESEATSETTGAGIAVMNAANPGNQLELYFNVATPVRYRLFGSVSVSQPGFATGVQLQMHNGIFWGHVFNSVFLPGSVGPFDVSGTLEPGQYRVLASIGIDAQGNATNTGTYEYQLDITKTGDMNCDGLVDGADIQPFVTALLDVPAYEAGYPNCNVLNGDIDGNSSLDLADAAPFAECVLQGGC